MYWKGVWSQDNLSKEILEGSYIRFGLVSVAIITKGFDYVCTSLHFSLWWLLWCSLLSLITTLDLLHFSMEIRSIKSLTSDFFFKRWFAECIKHHLTLWLMAEAQSYQKSKAPVQNAQEAGRWPTEGLLANQDAVETLFRCYTAPPGFPRDTVQVYAVDLDADTQNVSGHNPHEQVQFQERATFQVISKVWWSPPSLTLKHDSAWGGPSPPGTGRHHDPLWNPRKQQVEQNPFIAVGLRPGTFPAVEIKHKPQVRNRRGNEKQRRLTSVA